MERIPWSEQNRLSEKSSSPLISQWKWIRRRLPLPLEITIST